MITSIPIVELLMVKSCEAELCILYIYITYITVTDIPPLLLYKTSEICLQWSPTSGHPGSGLDQRSCWVNPHVGWTIP